MNASSHPAPARPARFARAAVVAAFIASLAALIAYEADPGGGASPAAPVQGNGFLHAPAADPSLPAAEHVFASQSDGAEAATPTF